MLLNHVVYSESMAVEKFIHGKHDDAKHDGRYANTKREQASRAELELWVNGDDELYLEHGLQPVSRTNNTQRLPQGQPPRSKLERGDV